MTETRATSRFVRLTAQKARLVVALIRGKPTKGYKTRHNKRTDRWIVQRRKVR